MKILYMGDGKWGKLSLSALLKAGENIVGVVIRTNPSDKKCSILAKKNNIPLFQPDNINSDSFFEILKELDPDLIVSMSYDQILRKRLINFPKAGVINAHAGMLPFYRGRSPINWALINGENQVGITVHYIDQNIDTGDIILQEKVRVKKNDDYKSILRKVEKIAPKLLRQAIILIKNDIVIPKKQSDLSGIYLPRRGNGDEIIDWNWSSDRIYNFIRALVPPGPGAVTFYKNIKVKILKASLLDSPDFIGHPGQVIGKDKNGFKVKTGDSLIRVEKIVRNNDNINKEIKIGEKFESQENYKLSCLKDKILSLEEDIEYLKNNILGDQNE